MSEHTAHTRNDQIVRMANDIASFFAGEPDHDKAVAGIVVHISRFWEPRMRRKLVERIEAGTTELDPLAREAAAHIAARDATVSSSLNAAISAEVTRADAPGGGCDAG